MASSRSSAGSQTGQVPAEPVLSLRNVEKSFGGVAVIPGVSFSVQAGEFVSLLGPSGSGKTTILRMIAGLEDTSAGEIWLKRERIDDRPPYERHVTTVFQDYALFPHMSVADNIAFGLRCRGQMTELEITRRVDEALSLMRLTGYGRRTIRHLSGGERQRVALARAVVTEPALLLLDEPLGALDLKLRREMGKELSALHDRLGLAFLYVTHDQEEALSMSDRVILIHRGRIEQAGPPADLFWRPRTRFVAEFIGEANVLEGQPIGSDGDQVRINFGGLISVAQNAPGLSPSSSRVAVAIRGERIKVGVEAAHCVNCFPGRVAETRFYGSLVELVINLAAPISVRVRATAGSPETRVRVGDEIDVGWEPSSVVILAE